MCQFIPRSDGCQDSKVHEPECRLLRYGGAKVRVGNFGQYNMMYASVAVMRALSLRQ